MTPLALAQVHHEPAAGLPALLVLVGAIAVFHGSVYVLVALNMGWRFGYWITGAAFGGLAVFLSIFWLMNALGPRGQEPRWFPLAVGKDQIGETTFNKDRFTTPPRYPSDPWEEPSGLLKEEVDPLKASLSNCVTFDPSNEDKVHEREREIAKLKGMTRTLLEGKFKMRSRMIRETEACEQAFELYPKQDSIPKIDGQPVAVIPDIGDDDIRFINEGGILLGQAIITPNTYDKRLTGDPEGRKPLRVGEPFRVLAYRDPGALRYPALVYTVLSVLWLAFHLWGLSRAERRKLSPVA